MISRCSMAALMGALLVAISTGNAAQRDAGNYPARPIRVVVPYAPGGATDIVGRALAPALSEVLGQQLIVDNRAGAAGNIALEIVARAQPDGYTILIGNVSTNSINPTAFASKLNFDPASELLGVTLLAAVPNAIVAGSVFPPNSLKEAIAYARARPGQLNFSAPLGSYSHLDMLDLCRRAGIEMVNVPSKGAGSSIAAIMGGEIHFSNMNVASAYGQIKAGRLKAYAVTPRERIAELPDVPTLTEAGFPGVGSDNWNGFFVPSKTPRAVIDKLHHAVLTVTQRPDIREMFAKRLIPLAVNQSPEEFRAFVRDELKRWARIIKENNVKFE